MKILIIGGNRFFGKKLAHILHNQGHELTLLNRGNVNDGLENKIERLICDRKDSKRLEAITEGRRWDVVYDQVCFEAADARAACRIFQDKTHHYIFTSTQSVYELGADIKEEAFHPELHLFTKDVSVDESYAEAKRQCEAVFFQQDQITVTAVRFPLVIGPDDYTGRFEFHVRRVLEQQDIYFPDPDARHCFIHSTDAARTLAFLLDHKLHTQINAANPEAISMRRLLAEIGNVTGQKPLLAKEDSGSNHSPCGIGGDWFMNSDKLASLGLRFSPVSEWLPELISEVAMRLPGFHSN